MKLKPTAAPTLDFRLHPTQSLVFQSEANEILYGGAAGGGKSWMLRVAAVTWAVQIPGIQIFLFRRLFPDLEKNHLQGATSFPMMLKDFIDQGWVKWNKSKYVFEFWNGSTISLCHCQKEEDRFKYLGAEFGVLLIDEMSQFTPVMYKFLRTRVRMTGIKVPDNIPGKFPRIVASSNPGGPGHQFMKATWVDVATPGEYYQAPADDGGMLRQFIPAKLTDNPTLLEEDPEYINRLRGMGDEKLVKAYLEGDFSVVIGGIFDDLWNEEIHFIQPFRIPQSWYVDRAFDWGSAKPFSVGWFAEADGDAPALMANGDWRHYPRGTLFQIGEWYGWNGKPDEGLRMTNADMAIGIRAIDEALGRKVYSGPADAAIFDDVGGNCIADDMADEGVHWVPADKSPGSRVQGIQRIRGMLQSSLETRPETPGIYFFNNCKHTKRILPACPRDMVKIDDIAKGFEDHVIDMLRYRVRGTKQAVTAFDNPAH